MIKGLKIVLGVIVSLVGLVLVLLLTHPLWIGLLAKGVAERQVPQLTGTPFTLGDCGLSAYSGKFHIGKMLLSNPEGFRQVKAVELGSLDVDLDVGTVLSDVIVIRDIVVRDVFVSYVSHKGTNNFDVMISKASPARAPQSPAACERADAGEMPSRQTSSSVSVDAPSASEQKAAPQKKVIIDRLVLSDLTVQWEMLTLPLPEIVLTDIGRESNGADWADVIQQLADAVMKQFGNLGKGLKDLGGALKDLGEEAGKHARDAARHVDARGAKQALVSGVEKAGTAVEAAADVAGSLRDGAGDALKDAGKALKEIFKK